MRASVFPDLPRARPGLRSETSRDEDSRADSLAHLSSPRRATPARALEGRRPAVPTRRLATAAIVPVVGSHPRSRRRRARLATDHRTPPPPSPSRQPPRSQVPRRARRQALAPRRAPGAVRDGRRGGARTRRTPARATRAAFDDDDASDAPPRASHANRGRNTNASACAARALQFGLGRWDKIRASLRPPSLEKRDVEDCVLASWDFVRAVADRCAGREARYLAARLRVAPKVEHHPDPLVGPWSKVPRNAAQSSARRLRLLDDVNRAAERCVAEETQDEALATFATMPDPKLPPWWNPDCDLFLLCGAREHGFGKYDETLRDATCAPGFKRAASVSGPKPRRRFSPRSARRRVRRRRRRRRGG